MAAAPFLRGLEREFRRGFLPVWILEALGAEGPLYGYALMDRLRRRVGDAARITPSTVYPTLARLRAMGLVESFHGTESFGPVRKYYRLTAGGRVALAEARALSRRLLEGPRGSDGSPSRTDRSTAATTAVRGAPG